MLVVPVFMAAPLVLVSQSVLVPVLVLMPTLVPESTRRHPTRLTPHRLSSVATLRDQRLVRSRDSVRLQASVRHRGTNGSEQTTGPRGGADVGAQLVDLIFIGYIRRGILRKLPRQLFGYSSIPRRVMTMREHVRKPSGTGYAYLLSSSCYSWQFFS